MPEKEIPQKPIPNATQTQEEDHLLRTKQVLPSNQEKQANSCFDCRIDRLKEESELSPWEPVKAHFRDRQKAYFLLLSIVILSLILDFTLKPRNFQNLIEEHTSSALRVQQKIANTTISNTSANAIHIKSSVETQQVITSVQPKQSSNQKTLNLILPSNEPESKMGTDDIVISKKDLAQEKEVFKTFSHISGLPPVTILKSEKPVPRSKASIVSDVAYIDKFVLRHRKQQEKIGQIQSKPTPPPPTTPPPFVAGISIPQKAQASRWIDLKNHNNPNDSLANQEREYYQRKYTISKYSQLPFCLVIPSYNNIRNNRHLKNIKSILQQEYTNYHIVFIDDASTDQTGNQIEQYLKQQTQVPPERYKVIRNHEQMRAMHNLRRAAMQFCQPDDIFMVIDGDDELIGRQILKLYNSLFQTTKAWFIYTNFLSITGTVGYSRPYPITIVDRNKYRVYPFVASHLRAFYTQLFRNIKDEDLRDQKGEYLKAANDVAICLPVMEQAGHRVIYMPQLTYFYNSETGQNNHYLRLKEQKANDRKLRGKSPYTILKQLHEDMTPNIRLSNITLPILQSQKDIEK